jgi:hypothetical protein
MSRHEITAVNPAHKIIIGWDPPLMTFFIQVVDRKIEGADDDDENDKLVYWAGTNLREIYEIDDLVRHARPYADIPHELRSTLYGDKDEDR